MLSDSTSSATLKEKLKWVFKIYDKDLSGIQADVSLLASSVDICPGFISMAEMVTVLGTVYGLEGIEQVEATDRVEFIFSLLDTNRN